MTESVLTRLSSIPFLHPTDLNPLQSQVDGLVSGFVREAANPTTLAAMMAGGMAYRLGRIGVMGMGSSSVLRPLSVVFGFGSEVTAFEFTNRTLQSVGAHGRAPVDPNYANLWSWSGPGGWREGLIHSAITFGMLKGAGFLGREQNLIFQHTFQSTAMVAGHQASSLLGITPHPEGTLAEQFLHAEATNLQLGAGMGLVHSLAPAAMAVERGLDLTLRFREGRATSQSPQQSRWNPFSLQPVAEGFPASLPDKEAFGGENEGETTPSSFAMSSIGEGDGSGRISNEIFKRVIREVIDRAKSGETEGLRNVVLQRLESHPDSPVSQLMIDRLKTRDPQQWRLALKFILSETRFHRLFVEQKEFFDFAQDWISRPHYKDILEIPIEFDRDLRRLHSVQREMAPLRQALVDHPTESGFIQFLLGQQITPSTPEGSITIFQNKLQGNQRIDLRKISLREGGTHFVGNWKHASVRITFDARGFIQLPLRAGNPLSPESLHSYVTPSPFLSPSPKAPAGDNNLTLQKGESTGGWADRLFNLSRNSPGETSLRIVTSLHEMLKNPSTAALVRDVLGHLERLTQREPEGKGILVRGKKVTDPKTGVEHPILLVSPPTTFLPEAWSHTFVEGITEAFRSNPTPVDQAIEVGSGTGFISIVLSKLGVARQIIAVDKNPHAPVVGAFNAALNGVTNIEFRKGDRLTGIPETADLILGCLPQMPSRKSTLDLRELADYAQETGTFEDRFGLGLMAGVLEQARARLTPDGKVWFMMADRPGPILLQDLFTRRGFHPNVLHTQLIQQDRTTDFSALADIERETGHQFVFRTRDGSSPSATEAKASTTGDLFHFLHLMEGRPYSSLFRKSLGETALKPTRWGYTEDPGTEHQELRFQLAKEWSREWGALVDPNLFFIGPHPRVLLEGLLKLTVAPGERVGLVGDFAPQELQVLSHSGEYRFDLLPLDPARIAHEIETRSYSAVLLDFPRQILARPQGLNRLLYVAAEQNTRLIFIESAPAMSDKQGRSMTRLISQNPEVLTNVVFLQSLQDRYQLPDYPLSVAVIPDPNLRRALQNYADVTYSRVSTFLQETYSRFFGRMEWSSKLSSFPPQSLIREAEGGRMPQTSLHYALSSPEVFDSSPKTDHVDPIDMSFGESEWGGLQETGAFLPDFSSDSDREVLESAGRRSVAGYLWESRRSLYRPDQIVLGPGVQPLIVSALRALREIQAKPLEVLVPEPSYGIFFPTILAAGAELMRVPTSAEDRFLLTAERLRALPPSRGRERAILLNEPSNPAGQYYRPEEWSALVRVMEQQQAHLLIDDVFYLLNFGGQTIGFFTSREEGMKRMGERTMRFGGLSKEFALGGIRLGFAASLNHPWLEMTRETLSSLPDPVALQAAQSYFPRFKETLHPHLDYLSPRAQSLEAFFTSRGFPVPRVEGGYSLFVDLNSLFETSHSIEGQMITRDNLHDLLMSHAGLKIKSDRWSGIPGHYRFVFSIDRLDEALERLRVFFDRVHRVQ